MKNEIKKTIHCSTPAEKKALQSPIPVKKEKKKGNGSAEESINSCLKSKQTNLPRHKDKGKVTQKQEEKCPLMHWGQTKGF